MNTSKKKKQNLLQKTKKNSKNFEFSKLPKKPRYRFPEIETHLLNCVNNELIGETTIKSSNEIGMDEDDIVHVIISKLRNYKENVVVKIHNENSIFVKKEIQTLKKIKNFKNSVNLLCDFSCMDEKQRWMNPVSHNVTFCNNKSELLHFFVFEYVKNGELDKFLQKTPTIEVLYSLFLQVAFSIITLNNVYCICHGDINTGNILIDHTEDDILTYTIDNKRYYVISHGIIPKLIDFGRSKEYNEPQPIGYVLEDIFIAFTVMNSWITNRELKRKIAEYIYKESNKVSKTPHIFIEELGKFFEELSYTQISS
jgi:serine/threonine protein kinase